MHDRSGGGVIQDIALGRKVLSSVPGPIKRDTLSPTARHRCDVSVAEGLIRDDPGHWPHVSI